MSFKMNWVFRVFLICIVCFSGCLSLDYSEENFPEASVSSGSSVHSSVSAGPAASTAPKIPENIGVVFEWNSVKTPLTGKINVGSSLYSGYEGIYFVVHGNRGGSIATVDGAFRLGGEDGSVDERLVIGSYIFSDSKTDVHIPGQFNISEGTYRLTVDYKDPVDYKNGYMLRVLINNNHTGQANSVLGNDSNIRQYSNVEALEKDITGMRKPTVSADGSEPGKLCLSFTPSVLYENLPNTSKTSLTKAFFALMCQADAGITVSGIKLERID